ncbi:DEAD/DEAH box helicase [archaeon]|jgi:DNA repair protein RadD|nr:DEAD/DEAH box helicase [archaeon]
MDINKLEDILIDLGVRKLASFINENILEQLVEVGELINAPLVASIILTEGGISCLRNSKIREAIYDSFQNFNYKEFGFPDKNSISFQWGNNNKTKNYLQIFGFNNDFLNDSDKNIEQGKASIFRPLYPYQNHIRRQIFEFLSTQDRNKVMVHMPTGAGKTRTALEASSDFMRTIEEENFCVVWLAHSEELCEQATSSFIEIWEKLGNRDVEIVRLWGGRKIKGLSDKNPSFIVASFDTAYSLTVSSSDEKFDFFSEIRLRNKLLIIDEAHQSIAPTYEKAIRFLSNSSTNIVGLTATPGRHHINQDAEETSKLSNFYDNNKINIVDDEGGLLDNPIDFLTKKKVLSDVEFLAIDNLDSEITLTEKEKIYMSNHLDIPYSVLDKLGKDSARTQKIVTQIIYLINEEGLPTIVFAPSKDSAIVISTLLKLHNIKSEAVTGDTPTSVRRESISSFKKGIIDVLVNYGVLTTGFDAPNIKAVVIARPTTSVVLYSQMIGRGLRGRLMGGEDICKVINVRDNLINMPNNDQAFLFFENNWN